jgi:hypothetical protein
LQKVKVKALYPLLVLSIYLLAGCSGKKDTPFLPGEVFFDYRIRGHEENDNLSIRAQFRAGDEEGEAVQLIAPGFVSFDGEKLAADSTKMDGYYYETFRPTQGFEGKHSFLYTDINKKTFQEEFEFKRFHIASALPDTLKRTDMEIPVEGLLDGDLLTVIMIDTSFENGITRKEEIQDNMLRLTSEDLGNLAPGPVQLELVREIEVPVKNATRAGGRILMVYSLKREFILSDN